MGKSTTEIIKELLNLLGIAHTDIAEGSVAGQSVYEIVTDNPTLLIGNRGETIRALDYLVKKIAEKNGAENVNFIVDAGDYQSKYIRDIEARAKILADRARSFEYDVEMPPMSAYERLIVHSALAEVPDVKTESQGEGRDRRVVIRYAVSSDGDL